MLKERIKTVTTFAFVLPVFDLDDVWSFIPTSEKHAVGYNVCRYSMEDRQFKSDPLEFYEVKSEAQLVARGYHEAMLEELDVQE